MTRNQAIICLQWSARNSRLILANQKVYDRDYIKSINQELARIDSVIVHWQDGQNPSGELGIWARYYFWWAVLIEYVYTPDYAFDNEVYSTGEKGFFQHMAKLLRDGRDEILDEEK